MGIGRFAIAFLAIMVVLLWAQIGTAAIHLTINEEDVYSIFLIPSEMCTIEVVSHDSSSYTAFLDYSLIQGSIWHSETRPEAGEYATVTNWPGYQHYEMTAFGFSPPPSAGIHFVFHYHGDVIGTDEILLWDDALMIVLDEVQIFVGAPGDLDPPTPDPMTWAWPPRALDDDRITMTATTASDPCGVEYYFACTTWGGHDSGWQPGTTYIDDDLQPGTVYTYRVKARDQSTNQNETEWSVLMGARTPNNVFVDQDAPGPTHNGSSWAEAFNDLQDALDVVVPGDEIRVAQGRYVPSRTTDPNDPRSVTFQLINGVSIKGGYAGYGEPDPNARKIVAYETILSGDINGDDDTGGDNSENCWHVVIGSSTEPNTVLEGLTISGGNADETSDNSGGGLYSNSGNLTVRRCTFTDNYADYGGGMCSINASRPTVTNCTFVANRGFLGGGMNNYYNSSPTITNCTFSGNIGQYAGGMFNSGTCSPDVIGCTFIQNSATTQLGGGMFNSNGCDPNVTNCTFTANEAATGGGGMANDTVSNPIVTNCILWDNTAPNGPQIYETGLSSATVTYSDVEGGRPGEGNIDADPNFFAPGGQDCHLQGDSPCINAGDPNGYYAGQVDMDGEPRKMGSEVDIGSDEVFTTAPGLLVWYQLDDYQWPGVAYNSGSFGASHTGYLMPDWPSGPNWVSPGYASSFALQFDGIDGYVEIPALDISTNAMTISAWIKGDGPQAGYTGIVSSRDQATSDATSLSYGSSGQATGSQPNQELCYCWNDTHWQWHSGLFIPFDEWAFVAMAVEPSQANLYLDDGIFYSSTNVASHGPLEQFDSASLTQIAHDDMHDYFAGLIDDVRIYNRALEAQEIADISGADLTRAWDPSPAHDAAGVAPDAVLTWKPGLYAADTNGHDVYFSTNAWLVSSRDPNAYQGRQDTNSFDPPGELEVGQTYLWAIDEVNVAHPNTLWPGQLWGFTTGAVIYVDANAAGANSGASWTDAFTDLQDALDIAQDGDQIWVAQGTYRPSKRTEPYQPRTETFQLADGVATYGGFPSGGGNWDGRDPNAYETILSGDLDGNDVPVLDVCDLPNEPTRADNAYHVVTGTGAGDTTIIDGFTLTAGNANGPFPHYNGAGMTCAVFIDEEFASGGNPTVTNCTFTKGSASHDGGGLSYCGGLVTNCTFTHNFAGDDGGALHFCSGPVADCNITGNEAYHCGGGLYKCSASLTDSVITENSAGGWGGGIYNSHEGGYGSITDCAISENSATYGGGIYNDACSPTITNCTLSDNDAAEGGGLLNYANVAPILVNCTFNENSAGTGGAIFNEDSGAGVLTNCAFTGNSASWNGGAICNLGSTPMLTNCSFSGNAANAGGAMYNFAGTPTLTNCTFSGNDAAADGGGVYSDPNTVPVIDNSVFWGNTDTGDGTQDAQIWGPASINYSCVEGWTGSLGGTGNIGDDPNFVRDPNDGGDGWDGGNNDDYGDLRLTEGSACIDAADNNSVPPDTADLDGDGNTTEPTSRDLIGHLRFIDDPNTVDTGSGASPIVDMGAYEFISDIYVDDDAEHDPGPGDPDESDPNEDGSGGHPFDSIQEAIDVSVDGDTIVVLPGTYMGIGNRDIDFGGRAITLQSTNPNSPLVVESTLIDCEGYAIGSKRSKSAQSYHRAFYFHSGEDANSVLRGFTITDGFHSQGGAVYCDSSSPTVRDCTFWANSAQDGGAMSISASGPIVTSCVFQENLATGTGGAIYSFNSSPLLTRCSFLANSADSGAGLFNRGGQGGPALKNCIFNGNCAYNDGGAMFNYQCSTLVANCTFSINAAGNSGGAIYNYQSSPALTSCILWANADSGPAGLAAQIDGSGTPAINYCCIQGCTGSLGGAGNIGSDPLLTPDDHLPAGSPCYNAGDPNGQYSGQTDIDGEARVIYQRVDIGADEFADSDADGLSDFWEMTHFGSLSVDPNDDTDGDGLPNIDEYGLYGSNPNVPPINVPGDYNSIQEAIDAADEGDTVLVAAGTWSGSGNRELDFGGKGVVLRSTSGAGSTVIDCNSLARAFDFHSGETSSTAVIGFTITNGLANFGGAVRCRQSHPQIRNCVFTGNTATGQGHSIHCFMSTPTLADCDISSGGPGVADIWMQYGGARILGLVRIFDCSWVGTGLTLTGDGTVLMGSGAELNLDESLVFCDFVGPVNVQVSVGSELTLDGDADIDLSDPCDPNVRGTIDCNGLLLVKDNVQISNANINVTKARFEDQTSIVNNVITIDRWAPPGQFVIERDVDVLYNDFHVNGDRYMDLTPRIHQGQFLHCRIFVTVTEGIGVDQGGLFECRGDPCFAEPNFADPCCDPNGFVCRVLPATIPDCNIRSWTIERMEFMKDAKLNVTNRFPFAAPWIPGDDDDVLYVKELILREDAVLNTAYNWVYYGSLLREPNSVITDVPLLGFSLICINFNNNLEYIVRVVHNNYKHPINPAYDREHVTRKEGNEPDINGMMQMCTIEDVDYNSPTCGQVISARAKGTFAKASEDQVLITFQYMFIEDPYQEAELIVYLSDEPALDVNLVEVALVRAPDPNRPGSVGSTEMATFYGSFPRGDLDFNRGTYIALELRGRGARCWIDDFDPSISCTKPKCGDYGQPFGSINVIDFLLLLAEFGLTNPASVGKGCLDLVTDGCINNDDLLVWDIVEKDHKCPLILAASAAATQSADASSSATLDESASLLIFGMPSGTGSGTPAGCLYGLDSNGLCLGDAIETQGNSRLVTDSLGNVYQINSNVGLIRPDGNVAAGQGVVSDVNNSVTIGFDEGDGLLLSDAAFSVCDPNIVYVVPVLVEPLVESGCPYAAAAKLELTGGGNYNVLQLYGKNPATDPTQSRWPSLCDDAKSFIYEPDVQHLHEIEVDSHGNLYVLSFVINSDANDTNDNDWLLIYDQNAGNDSEIRVPLSDPCVGDPNLKAPSAMALSASEEKIYFASSVSSANDLTTRVYCFTIDKTDYNATGLTYDKHVDINCPEPNICPEFCDENLGFTSFVTSMRHNPEDGNLYLTGFTAPKFAEDQALPSGIETVFTTPMLAVLEPGDEGLVEATEIENCDPNQPLQLPLSILWADEIYEGADLTGNGLVNFQDMAVLAQYWRDSCAGPDYCAGADLEPVEAPDGDVDNADLSILARQWLQGRCQD